MMKRMTIIRERSVARDYVANNQGEEQDVANDFGLLCVAAVAAAKNTRTRFNT